MCLFMSFPLPERRGLKKSVVDTTSGEKKLGDMFVHAGKVQNTSENA